MMAAAARVARGVRGVHSLAGRATVRLTATPQAIPAKETLVFGRVSAPSMQCRKRPAVAPWP